MLQALLNILLIADERRLVIDKANEEAQQLHQENPNETLNSAGAMPLLELDWDTNSGGKPYLEHYKRYILGG